MGTNPNVKDYKGKALLPLLIFLLVYIGSGVFFTIQGVAQSFEQIPRYVAIMLAIAIALLCYARNITLSEKVAEYSRGAGRQGIMMLSLVVLLAGGFQAAATAMGAQSSIVNMGIDLIPTQFLVPGVFLIACLISTCTGTSLGTQVAIIPVAIAMAEGAGLNLAMTGAAAIAGAYFGDAVAFISSTLICAVEGVGGTIREVAKRNMLICLPAIIITIVLYALESSGAQVAAAPTAGEYSLLHIIPYLIVIVIAMFGVSVIITLLLGILSTGLIGFATGSIGFFEWTKAIGQGMEFMFFLVVFASLVSGLIQLIEYYGGINWLLNVLTKKISGAKSCEYLISLVSTMIAGSTLNNTVAVIITAPIAKELAKKYESISPKKIAGYMSLFSSSILPVIPYDSSILLVQQYGGVNYLDILRYSYYPFIIIAIGILVIQFCGSKQKDEPVVVEHEQA